MIVESKLEVLASKKIYFMTHDQVEAMTLSDEIAVMNKVKKNAKIGEELIFGIRPEDITRIEKAKDVHQGNKIETIIDVIEPMGSELILSLATGKHIIQATVDPDIHLKVGQKMTVAVDTNKMHLFKLDNEETIF